MSPDETVAARVLEAVGNRLRGVDRLGVAFSGGVDSSVLLAAATRTLGPSRVVAILAVSPSLATAERSAAHEVAGVIGVPVVEVSTRELDNPAYRANAPDRCYHCKNELFTRIDDDVARRHGLDAIAYGENADDARRSDRPGGVAATEHAVLRPLADGGVDKVAVRAAARAWGLPCAEKPAAPCLASRIPHFQPVTREKLTQIDEAEAGLHRLGLAEVRVRHHGLVARIELPAEVLERAAREPLRGAIREVVLQAGFEFVTLDLGALQSGHFTLSLQGGAAR